MLKNPTIIHISVITAIGAFSVSALAIFLGFMLIEHGTTGSVALEFKIAGGSVNFYSFVPGVAFGLFGAAIAWRALSTLIGRPQ
jgi:hypothetical protein